jgi:hypothetical protein
LFIFRIFCLMKCVLTLVHVREKIKIKFALSQFDIVVKKIHSEL